MECENKSSFDEIENNAFTADDNDNGLQPLFQSLVEYAQNLESKSFQVPKPSDKVMSRSEADKFIEKQNDIWQDELVKDAESKRNFRRNILIIVFILLGAQIAFLNVLIWKVIVTAFKVDYETHLPVVHQETIKIVVDMLKWYATAIVAELLATLIFIVKSVFATPKKFK